MKRMILTLALFAAALPTYALPPEAEALIAEARAAVTVVDQEALKQALGQPGVLVLDIREADELEAGRVAGAVNIPRGMLEMRIWPFVETDGGYDMQRPIYTYCKSGGRAVLSAYTLKRLGFEQVHAVEMKFSDWLEAGYPVEGDF